MVRLLKLMELVIPAGGRETKSMAKGYSLDLTTPNIKANSLTTLEVVKVFMCMRMETPMKVSGKKG